MPQSASAHNPTTAFTQTSNMPTCRHFGSKVKLWATFNEPGVMGFCGWIYGTFPPAKTIQWATAGRHMCNMLRAHTAAYQAIKAMPGVVICADDLYCCGGRNGSMPASCY